MDLTLNGISAYSLAVKIMMRMSHTDKKGKVKIFVFFGTFLDTEIGKANALNYKLGFKALSETH